jgi:hypothetical protein
MEFAFPLDDSQSTDRLNEAFPIGPESPEVATATRAKRRGNKNGRTDGGTLHLTDEDKLAVIRIALRRQDAFGSSGVPKTKFWKTVADELSQLNGKTPHKTLGRVMTKLVDERETELEAEGSGNQEGHDDLLIALDDWVAVVRDRRARDATGEATKTRIDSESREAVAFRQSQLSLWTDRRHLSLQESESSGSATPQIEATETPSLPLRKRRRWAEETSIEDPFKVDFRRLVDSYISRNEERRRDRFRGDGGRGDEQLEGVGERIEGIEAQLGTLERGVSKILQILEQKRKRKRGRKQRRVKLTVNRLLL